MWRFNALKKSRNVFNQIYSVVQLISLIGLLEFCISKISNTHIPNTTPSTHTPSNHIITARFFEISQVGYVCMHTIHIRIYACARSIIAHSDRMGPARLNQLTHLRREAVGAPREPSQNRFAHPTGCGASFDAFATF